MKLVFHKKLLELSISPSILLAKVENWQIAMHGLMKLFKVCLTDKLENINFNNYEIIKLMKTI